MQVASQVRCRVELAFELTAPARLALQIAPPSPTAERLDLEGGEAVASVDEHQVGDARVHVLDAPAGSLAVSYEAEVALGEPSPVRLSQAEELRWRRQSRYCPSDRLEDLVHTVLADQLQAPWPAGAIAAWVHDHLRYEIGSSGPTTDAVDTFLAARGVCRDFAHLTIALCRAAGIPARFVAVYAPGLDPMDFHAVVEAPHDGSWAVLDPTGLAPRASMVRICTGRDAADTALVTTLAGTAELTSSTVVATAHPALPADDPAAAVRVA